MKPSLNFTGQGQGQSQGCAAGSYYNQSGQPITPAAYHAIIAAKHWHNWGRHAATRYAERHGSSLRLVTIARQLMATSPQH